MRYQGVLVKRPLLMRTPHLGASLLYQYVVEVDHYMTLRSVDELLLVLHGHRRVIMALHQLLLLMMIPLLAHGFTEELLKPLRVGEDVRLLLVLTLVHFLHATRPRGTPFRGQLMRDWLHEILHHVTLARVSVLPASADIERFRFLMMRGAPARRGVCLLRDAGEVGVNVAIFGLDDNRAGQLISHQLFRL